MAELAGLGLLVIWGAMTLLWLVSLHLQNSSIVDIFWGAGFVVLAWFYFLNAEGYAGRKLLIIALVTIWGLRLTGYIFWRNHSKPEDFRYQKWRNEAGASWWWQSYFRVFVLQGILLWVVAMPLLAAQTNSTPDYLTILDILGAIVWGIGFIFEAGGDYQLATFKANPANKGKVMNKGLWRYTRHPNYFGDATQWWGFYLIALAGGGWWTIFSPILMTLLLMKVSGVALLEKTLTHSKEGYQEYIARTNAFFPWFPKS